MTTYFDRVVSVSKVFLATFMLCSVTPAQALERWVYCSQNLLVEQRVTDLIGVMERAAKAGYTHVLLSDSKFGHLGDLDARYFQNVARVKQAAADLHLEIVPALFPIGYSNDLLFNDPNLIEALPVEDTLLVVQNGVAQLQADPAVSLPSFTDLTKWSWKDEAVVPDDGAARVTDPKGANARIVQKVKVHPFHQYHISVEVKTDGFGTPPEVKARAGNLALNFNSLGVRSTQDWQTCHAVFNSLSNSEVSIYFGAWGGSTGSLWWKNPKLEELAFLNLVRRPGAPLTVRTEEGRVLTEGTDFEPLSDPLMGTKPWPGSYDVYHQPPQLRTSKLPDGTRVRASWYHGVTLYEDQASICLSEPKTEALLRDQARRMHEAWHARSYFMSHDEIRVMNWCAACQKRHLDAGAMLAENVRLCTRILREVNPGGRIFVWSDMFDPNHNAHKDYYLVRGNLAGSWEGLDKEVIVVPWYFERRAESLRFFAERGHRQLIAGYYDAPPAQVTQWLEAARPFPGIMGVMYTTWQNHYTDLDPFAALIANFPAPEAWSK